VLVCISHKVQASVKMPVRPSKKQLRKREKRARRQEGGHVYTGAAGTVTETRVVGVVVSYMDSDVRWALFEAMMRSVGEQCVPLDTLYVWMSFETAEHMAFYESRWRALLPGTSRLSVKFTGRVGRMSQGEGWWGLWREYGELREGNTWVVFGDDDDVWHPERVLYYRRGVSSVGRRMDVTHISASHYAESESVVEGVRSAKDVEDLLREGKARRMRSTGGYESRGTCRHGGNYVDHCVRGGVVGEFLAATNGSVRGMRYCDVLMESYVRKRKGNHLILELSDRRAPWMYYWRRHEGSQCVEMGKGKSQEEKLRMNVELMASYLNPLGTVLSEIRGLYGEGEMGERALECLRVYRGLWPEGLREVGEGV